jgi:hypothetical protein
VTFLLETSPLVRPMLGLRVLINTAWLDRLARLTLRRPARGSRVWVGDEVRRREPGGGRAGVRFVTDDGVHWF